MKELHPDFHTIIIKPRETEIDLKAKSTVKIRKKKNYFIKRESIFRDYKDDNPEILKKCCEVDLNYSKFSIIFKSEIYLQREVKNMLIKKYYKPIKDLFMHFIPTSKFPNIGWRDFVKICHQVINLSIFHHQSLI
jgi:hypothetical protein